MSIWHWIVTLVIVAMYLVPGLIASARHHHNLVAIWTVNLLLGWSVLGWIIAFVWSLTSPAPAQQVIYVERTQRAE